LGGRCSFRGFNFLHFVGEGPESNEKPVADLWSDEEFDEDDGDEEDEDDKDDDADDDNEDESEVVDSERFLFLSTTRELSSVNVWKVLEYRTWCRSTRIDPFDASRRVNTAALGLDKIFTYYTRSFSWTTSTANASRSSKSSTKSWI